MRRYIRIVLSVLILSTLNPQLSTLMADDVKKPDTQLADNTFFDPTRKDKVEEQYAFGME